MRKLTLLIFILILVILGCDSRDKSNTSDTITGIDDNGDQNIILLIPYSNIQNFYIVNVYNNENSLQNENISLVLNNSSITLSYNEWSDSWEGDFELIDIPDNETIHVLDVECHIGDAYVTTELELVNRILNFEGPYSYDVANGAQLDWVRAGDVKQQYIKGEKTWLDGSTKKYYTKNRVISAPKRSFDMPGNWLGPPRPYNEYAFTLSCMNYNEVNGFMVASCAMSKITYTHDFRTFLKEDLDSDEIHEEFRKIQESLSDNNQTDDYRLHNRLF